MPAVSADDSLLQAAFLTEGQRVGGHVWPVPADQKVGELARLYGIKVPPARDVPISWNVAPQQDVLAVRRKAEIGQRSLDALRWG